VSGIRLVAGDPEHVRGEQVTGTTGIDMAFHGTLRCANDVVGQFEASFRSPRRQHMEIVGEDGVLIAEAPWRIDWGGAVTLARRADGEVATAIETIPVETANSYRLQLDNLADAVAGRAPQLLGRDDALGQARTIEALYRSAAERRVADVG
jgi:predicted dehydrogenase